MNQSKQVSEIDPLWDFHAGRIGKSRTGKTLGILVDTNHFPKCCIYDTTKDFIRTLTEPVKTMSGKEIKLGSHFKIVEGDLRQLVKTFNQGFWQVVYVPEAKPKTPEEQIEFSAVARIIHEMGKFLKWNYNLSFKFVIDEIWHFADKNTISPELLLLIREGLKEKISIRWSSQRLAQTHQDVVTQCRYVDVFNIWARDVEYLNELIKEITEEVVEALGPYEFLRYDIDKRSLIQFGRLD